jgi:hypothetical protein
MCIFHMVIAANLCRLADGNHLVSDQKEWAAPPCLGDGHVEAAFSDMEVH